MSAKVKGSNLTDKKEILRIVTKKDIIQMKDVPSGTEITVRAYVLQEVTKDRGADPNGEIFDSILIAAEDGKVYATRSGTFIEDFLIIVHELDDVAEEGETAFSEPLVICVSHMKSKSTGNNFACCSLA